MNYSALFGGLRATSDTAQYPDKNLYKAATLLKPEERPTVPVRMYNDADEAYEPYGLKGNYKARAFTSPRRDKIMVSSKTPDYRDIYKLAGMLGHEQVHVSDRFGEGPAYRKELEINSRFKDKVNPTYLRNLQTYVDNLRER